MIFRNKFFMIAAVIPLLAASCAKAPEWSKDATMNIEAVTVENVEKYKVHVSVGISNDNSGTAFTGMSGQIILKDAAAAILTLPFKSATILPFEKGIVEAETVITKDEAVKIAEQMNIDNEKFIKDRGVKEHFLEKENVTVDISSFDKTDIIKLLKDKVNEKSK